MSTTVILNGDQVYVEELIRENARLTDSLAREKVLASKLDLAIQDLHTLTADGDPCEMCTRRCTFGAGDCKPVWRGETEECGELVQAAQKVRRARKGTTPMSLDDALVKLCEESADVLLCIDALILEGFINEMGAQFIGRHKNDRWHERTFGEGGDEIAKAKQNDSAVGSETGGETCCGAPT